MGTVVLNVIRFAAPYLIGGAIGAGTTIGVMKRSNIKTWYKGKRKADKKEQKTEE